MNALLLIVSHALASGLAIAGYHNWLKRDPKRVERLAAQIKTRSRSIFRR